MQDGTARRTSPHLPEASFVDHANVRSLRLGSRWEQGAMRLDDPCALVLEYVQRMMAGLLFMAPDAVAKRHAMQLGLGAGALTRFCRKKLRMRTSAIEINPAVVHACRGWFALPQDDDRLQVVVADAADEIRRQRWAGSVDMLHVDLYDTESAAPVLDSEDFYRDCRALLTPHGSMAVNLLGRTPYSLHASLDRIAAAFGGDALWSFPLAPERNTVVLAQRTPQAPEREVLTARAAAIESRWGLPARRWAEEFSPMGS